MGSCTLIASSFWDANSVLNSTQSFEARSVSRPFINGANFSAPGRSAQMWISGSTVPPIYLWNGASPTISGCSFLASFVIFA